MQWLHQILRSQKAPPNHLIAHRWAMRCLSWLFCETWQCVYFFVWNDKMVILQFSHSWSYLLRFAKLQSAKFSWHNTQLEIVWAYTWPFYIKSVTVTCINENGLSIGHGWMLKICLIFCRQHFEMHFPNENHYVLVRILLKFVSKGPVDAPSHYLNQYWLIISEVSGIHLMSMSQEMLKIFIVEMSLKIIHFKITATSPMG